jgi:hypothetical protein
MSTPKPPRPKKPLPEAFLAALAAPTPVLIEQCNRSIIEEFLEPIENHDRIIERWEIYEAVREALEFELGIARLEIDEDGRDAASALAEAAKYVLRKLASTIGYEAPPEPPPRDEVAE